jgi:CHAT domain-containing protein
MSRITSWRRKSGSKPSPSSRCQTTETSVKQTKLDQYRIVYFATHALVSGETAKAAKGLAEPALVLSLPVTATAFDDGLLTSSEVAQLKLNADWVVLSACNTAAGDRPGAEALSGLARAFFYAGARALLVSHWPVESEPAVKLMTTTFATIAENPKLGMAEALRRSMLSLMDDRTNPEWANPTSWGPFVLVGEGGAFTR